MDLDLSPRELLTTTRTVRKRLDLTKPVARDDVEECVRIGWQAPNGSNQQMYNWVLVDDPATRVEMALRGDDEINDDDVRSLMSAYLDARTRRRRARQLTEVDNGASRSRGAVDETDTRSPPRRVLRPKDARA